MVSMIICAEHVIFYAGISMQFMQQNGIQETATKGQMLMLNWLWVNFWAILNRPLKCIHQLSLFLYIALALCMLHNYACAMNLQDIGKTARKAIKFKELLQVTSKWFLWFSAVGTSTLLDHPQFLIICTLKALHCSSQFRVHQTEMSTVNSSAAT